MKMDPIVNRVKKKYEKQLQEFRKLDIRTIEGEEKVKKYSIAYTPTFVIIDKNDKEIDRMVGNVEEKILEKFIESNIKRAKRKKASP